MHAQNMHAVRYADYAQYMPQMEQILKILQLAAHMHSSTHQRSRCSDVPIQSALSDCTIVCNLPSFWSALQPQGLLAKLHCYQHG